MDFALATIELGHMTARGGRSWDVSIGDGVESSGDIQLAKWRLDLSAAKRRELTKALEQMKSRREPLALMLDRIRRLEQVDGGWRYRFQVLTQDIHKNRDVALADSRQRTDCLSRLVLVDLALCSYCDDHGAWPDDLNLLVPDYLATLPLDPYSGKPLKYRAASPEFLLYSVGPDGQDDGGKFENRFASGHPHRLYWDGGKDFCLDLPARPAGK
jgi:hypothetical protein